MGAGGGKKDPSVHDGRVPNLSKNGTDLDLQEEVGDRAPGGHQIRPGPNFTTATPSTMRTEPASG